MTFWENPKKCSEIFKKYIQNLSKIENRQKITICSLRTYTHTHGKLPTPITRNKKKRTKGGQKGKKGRGNKL